MEKIIGEAFVNDKVVMNLLFAVAFHIIMSIISYKVLERYSWKENIFATYVVTFGVDLIKLSGLGFFSIMITAAVQTATMVVIDQYIYDKDYDIRDYIFRATILNICAMGGEIMTCLLWMATDSVIKTFGLLIIFVLAVNAMAFVLFNGGQGSGAIILLDCIIYIVAVFVIGKMNEINLLDLTKDSSTVNYFIKIIAVCILFGFINALVDKNAYEENDEMKPYLIISSLKTYAINMTILLLIYIYIFQSLVTALQSISIFN